MFKDLQPQRRGGTETAAPAYPEKCSCPPGIVKNPRAGASTNTPSPVYRTEKLRSTHEPPTLNKWNKKKQGEGQVYGSDRGEDKEETVL